MIKSPLEMLVNILSSEDCLICQKNESVLCESCFTTNILQNINRCYMCNKLTKTSGVCSSCHSKLRRVWWLGNYNEPLKTIIWQMKFNRKRSNARLLASYLAQTVPYLSEDTIVISVPTAPKRIRQRGFDQASLIGQTFAEKRGFLYKNCLFRLSSIDLIGKSRSDRRKLMTESIDISESQVVNNQSVLLIDDVLTTGASMEAAASLLRKHGAKHVDGAVVARKLLT